MRAVFWSEELQERIHLENLGADEEDYVKTDLQKNGIGGYKECSSISGQEPMTGGCEDGGEQSGCITCGEFLEQLELSWLLKKECAPWGQPVNDQSACFYSFAHLLICFL